MMVKGGQEGEEEEEEGASFVHCMSMSLLIYSF